MPGQRPQSERVYKLLQESGGFVSSQEICRRLGITRAAVWKQVQVLRKKGVSIEGVSSVGYRLSALPDALHVLQMQPGIRTRRVGRKIVVKQETGSTNDDIWALAGKGEPEGTVVIAESQSAGKGRRGRQWASPAGMNLYLSVLLRPPLLPAEASLITLLAAVQMCEALHEQFPDLNPQIKWPNDVLLDGKKAAGILAEIHAEQESIHFLVLGIGINLNMTQEMFPGDILYPATSVAIVLGRKVDRVCFSRRLLEKLDSGYNELLLEGSASLRSKWMSRCAHASEKLEVSTPKGVRKGRFQGIDEEGAMILVVDGVKRIKIRAGDVRKVSRGT